MKITKQKLKEIVREELAQLQEGKFYVKSFSNSYDEMYLGNDGKFTDFQNSKTFSKASDAQKVAKKHKSKGAIAVVDSSGKSVKFAENINEAKISPADKKQFQSDAQEILDNFIKAKLVTKDTEFHVVKNSLRHVFSAIANGEGNANYNKVKKYMPKKLNNDLYDNGEKNSYDSVWFSMNDAQRETIFLKAIRAKKLNLSEDSINEDQYGDVSFSRRKLKLASEDAECVLHCLADKAENEELPNWWIDKVSKAADYLNVCRDYIKTDDLNGIHEDTEKEYPIWGIPPGKNSEELLYTRATSHSQAKKIARILRDKHGCKKVRIQVLDLAQNPADIFNSDKLFK